LDRPLSRPLNAVLDGLKALHPRAIDLSLGRIERLLAGLGHPERRLAPVVHVAGTNGKGSVVAFLRALLSDQGFGVHVYTSPHLVRFNERIVVGGREVGDGALIQALEACERINAGLPITYFEITTAAAFLLFAEHPADVTLLETGLGGRLDATNVIDRPALTLLTPIALDHQHYLGDTLGAIAAEKAGILKPGVACVSARQQPAAASVIVERARAIGAPLAWEGVDWSVAAEGDGFVYANEDESMRLPALPLAGEHQLHNAGLALAAVQRLAGERRPKDVALDAGTLGHGLAQVRWPARLQKLDDARLLSRLPDGWELWLDGGHNPSAAAVLANHARTHWANRPLHLIVAMLASKDVDGFLAPLAPLVGRTVAVPIPGEANTISGADLAAAAARCGMTAATAETLDGALAHVISADSRPARVLIAGSLYFAGSVLSRGEGTD
jgi:dihydrofolate synthase / folylpolyglutamate synthase